MLFSSSHRRTRTVLIMTSLYLAIFDRYICSFNMDCQPIRVGLAFQTSKNNVAGGCGPLYKGCLLLQGQHSARFDMANLCYSVLFRKAILFIWWKCFRSDFPYVRENLFDCYKTFWCFYNYSNTCHSGCGRWSHYVGKMHFPLS